jgi:hypothetical protein
MIDLGYYITNHLEIVVLTNKYKVDGLQQPSAMSDADKKYWVYRGWNITTNEQVSWAESAITSGHVYLSPITDEKIIKICEERATRIFRDREEKVIEVRHLGAYLQLKPAEQAVGI